MLHLFKLTTLALALAFGCSSPAVLAGDCQAVCYAAKSQAYQRCRAIPAADRAARRDCFRSADSTLKRCLSRCGR